MKRQALITFLVANMKEATLDHFKANKAQYGMATVNQTAVKNFLNNANTTDEMIQQIAEACGYTEESTTDSAPEIVGVDTVMVKVDTVKNGTIEVPAYALRVLKWDVAESATLTDSQAEMVAKAQAEGKYINIKGKGPVVKTPVLKLDFGGTTCTSFNKLFSIKSVRDSINVGDTVYVRKDSLTPIKGKGYTYYSGAVLEASNEAMQEARAQQIQDELEFAELDVATQKRVQEKLTEAKADAYIQRMLNR